MSIIIFKIKNIVWNNKQNKIYIIIKICREQTIKKSVYKMRIHEYNYKFINYKL